MPNWCNNYACVIGPKKLIEEIFGNKDFSLQKMVPCPVELQNGTSPAPKNIAEINVKKYGYQDWYSWNIDNWGTKWDPGPVAGEICEVSEELSQWECYFDSAWSPPTAGFQKISEKYPQLSITLEYFESGCCFFGVAKGGGGEWEDNFNEYSSAADLEECLKHCPCGLAESEVDYLKELEDEREAEDPVESEAPTKPIAKVKKVAKKVATKKASTKEKKPTAKKVAVKKKTAVKKTAVKKVAAKKVASKKS